MHYVLCSRGTSLAFWVAGTSENTGTRPQVALLVPNSSGWAAEAARSLGGLFLIAPPLHRSGFVWRVKKVSKYFEPRGPLWHSWVSSPFTETENNLWLFACVALSHLCTLWEDAGTIQHAGSLSASVTFLLMRKAEDLETLVWKMQSPQMAYRKDGAWEKRCWLHVQVQQGAITRSALSSYIPNKVFLVNDN